MAEGIHTATIVTNTVHDAFLKGLIPSIPDFPIPGICFKDITPLLANPEAFSHVIDASAGYWKNASANLIAAVEARGFVLGSALAHALGLGLVIVRKPGKLPGARDRFDYTCEYCSGQLEVEKGLVKPGQEVIVVDDLLATGGTARAVADYVISQGARVSGYSFLIELSMLNGRRLLSDARVHAELIY